MLADELMHTIKQLVAQALVDQRPFVYGHISSYDPNGHRVKCIIPSMTDENGVPLLSPWMPMGSLSAGAGYGVQVIYQGGATAQNPTGGEQVLVGLFDRARGVSAVPALFFNNENQPPATNLPSGASPAVPGDVLISNPSGSLLRLHANGDLEYIGTGKVIITTTGNVNVTTQGTVSVTSQGDASVTTQGNATVNATGNVTIVGAAILLCKAIGDTLQALCTQALSTWAAAHTHPGNNQAPSTQPPTNAVTSIVKAE